MPTVFRLPADFPLLKTDDDAHKALAEWWVLVKAAVQAKKGSTRAQKEFAQGTPEYVAAYKLVEITQKLFGTVKVSRRDRRQGPNLLLNARLTTPTAKVFFAVHLPCVESPPENK